MYDASPHDNSLLARLRREINAQLDTEIEALITQPTEQKAGYIQGLRDALHVAEDIGREMNNPREEKA